ncbi:MAG: hypothetical protein QM758_27480 [Armatimonas sp.]
MKELRQALSSGNTTTIVNSHSDEALIRLLKMHYRPAAFVLRYLIFASAFWLVVFLGALLHFWPLPVWLNAIIFLPGLLILRLPQVKEGAWSAIQQRIEKAELPVLLDAHALNVFVLRYSIQAGLIRRLTVASPEELEALAPEQRKSLVRFTLKQLRPQWVGYHIVPDTETHAATLAYLALATLKQPGAEKPDRRGIHSTSHTNLRAAIEEYLEAMGQL